MTGFCRLQSLPTCGEGREEVVLMPSDHPSPSLPDKVGGNDVALVHDFPDIAQSESERPSCAGGCLPTSRWRNSPGSASAGRRRCCSCRRTRPIWRISSARLPADIPVTVVGLGSNLIVRDGGVPGVVVRLGRGFNEITVEGTRDPRRRGGAGREGRARGAGGGPRRAVVPARHSRRDRRRAAHERRRLWPRDQGRAGCGARGRSRRRASMC